MNVTITIDADACIGYGECVAENPEAVELDDGGCARLRVSQVDVDKACRLCAACPTGAISVVPNA